MTAAERLADQIERSFGPGTWVDVPLGDLFDRLSADEAAAHVLPGAHSAWEIRLHIAAWHDAARRRLGGSVVELEGEEDWPLVGEPTEARWRETLDRTNEMRRALVETVRAMTDDDLARTVPGKPYDATEMLTGIPQHDHYHGGQVRMLIKALRGE